MKIRCVSILASRKTKRQKWRPNRNLTRFSLSALILLILSYYNEGEMTKFDFQAHNQHVRRGIARVCMVSVSLEYKSHKATKLIGLHTSLQNKQYGAYGGLKESIFLKL